MITPKSTLRAAVAVAAAAAVVFVVVVDAAARPTTSAFAVLRRPASSLFRRVYSTASHPPLFSSPLAESIDGGGFKVGDKTENDDDDVVQKKEKEEEDVTDLLMSMQSLGAITGRGEFVTDFQASSAKDLLGKLEDIAASSKPAADSSVVDAGGTWELVYTTCSGQLFRSSPFFMSGRAVCKTERQAEQYDWFCTMHRKALAISTIGAVRQIIDTENNRMTSEFEVKVGAVPFLNDLTPFSYAGGLPFTIDGAIVSTADIAPASNDDDDDDGKTSLPSWEVYMDTVEIKGSNIPLLRQVLDNDSVKLETRRLADVLENAIDSYETPRASFRTTFLNDRFRIGRDQDDNAFLYVRTSAAAEPTRYTNVEPDLGIGKLLEGFNDAVTKIYI